MTSLGARLLSTQEHREDPRRTWRRLGVAVLVSAIAHALALTELPQLGHAPEEIAPGPPLAARLAKAEPPRPAAPQPKPRPKARPAAPAAEPVASPVPAELPAPVQEAQAAASTPQETGAREPARAEVPPAPSAAVPVQPAPPAQVVEVASPLPEYAEIEYDLSKGGNQFIGKVTHVWQRSGSQYEVRSVTEASGLMSLFFSGRLVQLSKGTLTESGLRPDRFTVQRGREDRLESASFDWGANTGTLAGRGNPRNWPLVAGTQDQLSFLYQLANLLSRDGARRVAVTNARGVDTAALEVLGEESIETGAGGMVAVHVRSRLGNEGGTVEVWLSQQHQFLPVKIRLRDKRGEEAEQVASAIRVR